MIESTTTFPLLPVHKKRLITGSRNSSPMLLRLSGGPRVLTPVREHRPFRPMRCLLRQALG